MHLEEEDGLHASLRGGLCSSTPLLPPAVVGDVVHVREDEMPHASQCLERRLCGPHASVSISPYLLHLYTGIYTCVFHTASFELKRGASTITLPPGMRSRYGAAPKELGAW